MEKNTRSKSVLNPSDFKIPADKFIRTKTGVHNKKPRKSKGNLKFGTKIKSKFFPEKLTENQSENWFEKLPEKSNCFHPFKKNQIMIKKKNSDLELEIIGEILRKNMDLKNKTIVNNNNDSNFLFDRKYDEESEKIFILNELKNFPDYKILYGKLSCQALKDSAYFLEIEKKLSYFSLKYYLKFGKNNSKCFFARK